MSKVATTTITIPSTRVYLDQINKADVEHLLKCRDIYTKAKEKLYNLKYDKEFLKTGVDNETAYMKDFIKKLSNVKVQDYHITSLMSHSGGMLSSQKELMEIRAQEAEVQHDTRKTKLKTLKRRLTLLKKTKASLVRYYKDDCKHFKNLYIPKDFESHLSGEDKDSVHKYELWVNSELKAVKARINMIKHKDMVESKKSTKPSRVTFGGKRQYKTKDTTDIDHTKWHEERQARRNHMMLFSGRFDSANKNYLCKYDMDKQHMEISLLDGYVLKLDNLVFPYRTEDLRSVLTHPKEKGYSVGYWLDFRKDGKGREYFLVKATITLHKSRLNDDTSTGLIAADLNLDNISWTELDEQGHRLDSGVIAFDLTGKSSNQIGDILGRACKQVTQLCIDRKKPLAKEDISLIKKSASLAYGKKKANHGTRMFAYRKMDNLLRGQAFKNDIAVFTVNPAYTSLIGAMKYMYQYRISVHSAASYVIGRRALGFSEKMPTVFQALIPDTKRRSHHWKQYAHVYPLFKEIHKDKLLHKLSVITDKDHLETVQR